MDLLLWRHAEAEEGGPELPDAKRPLTARGHRQAARMAGWLRAELPPKTRILCSPTLRTRQTVAALDRPVEILPELGPEACVSALIAASGWPASPVPVLIVGHQPTLGRLAALLLSGTEADWSFKKGALWWLSRRVRREAGQTVLRCALPAEWVSPN